MDLAIENVTQPLAEWALDYGIPCALIRDRLAKGWSVERAVTEPMRHTYYRLTRADMIDAPYSRGARVIEFDGKTQTVKQWAKHLGIDRQVIYDRLRKGYPIADALDGVLRTGKRKRQPPLCTTV